MTYRRGRIKSSIVANRFQSYGANFNVDGQDMQDNKSSFMLQRGIRGKTE